MHYRDSEIDDDLAYKYYKKRLGIADSNEMKESNDNYNEDDYDNDDDFAQNSPQYVSGFIFTQSLNRRNKKFMRAQKKTLQALMAEKRKS